MAASRVLGMALAVVWLLLPALARAEDLPPLIDLPGGTYRAATPPGWDGKSPLPLLLFLHGYSDSSAKVMGDAKLVAAVTGSGALLIAPDGQHKSWSHTGSASTGRDDITFLGEVVADAERRWPVDTAHVFASGFSQGGSMVWELACHAATGFAAFLPFSGSFWEPYPERCETGPINLRHVHGLTDHTMPMAGRALRGGLYRQGDVRKGIDILLDTDRCDLSPDQRMQQGQLDCAEWNSCASGKRIELCLHPGDHWMEAQWLQEGIAWAMALPVPPPPLGALMALLADRMGLLGTESAFEVLARAKALEARGKSIINLGIGQPDFATPAHIVEAGCQALRDGHHGYTPANGILPLREAVAADLQRRHGVAVSPDSVLVVPGGKVTMFFAILMFGQAGAEILYPNPGFPIYESVIRFSGATPVPIPLHEEKGFSFSAEEVLARITPATRLLILNSPANPTGGVVPRAELDALAAGLERHKQVAILSDEIYGEILYDGAAHVSLLTYPALRDRVILLDGWSKSYAMTGWRLGYGVWPQRFFGAAERLAINSHSCVNAAAQFAGLAALTGPRAPVARMVAAFAERRRLIVDKLNALPGFRCVAPGGAFYAFPNIAGTGFSSRELEARLLDEAGVALLSGTSFGAQGEGFLRFSYAASAEAITEAVARIETWLRQQKDRRA